MGNESFRKMPHKSAVLSEGRSNRLCFITATLSTAVMLYERENMLPGIKSALITCI